MRRLVRDYRYRATDPAFTFYLWQSVRANEEKSIFPYISRCYEVIDSTLPYEVGMLKPYLQDILARMGREDRFYEQAEKILKSVARVQEVPAELMTKNSLYKEFI
jgi:uridine kinase